MIKKLLLIFLLCSIALGQSTGLKPVLGTQLDWGQPKTKGLVGAWFNQEAAPTGGTLFDLSGNGKNGTLAGDVHSVPGPYGPALELGGVVGDYVGLGDIQFGLGDFSLVISFKSTSATSQVLYGYGDYFNNAAIYVGLRSGGTIRYNLRDLSGDFDEVETT